MALSKDDLPEEVESAIIHKQGDEWLDHALEQVSQLEDDWDFNTVEVLGGQASLLLKVEDSEQEAVLKIPSNSKAGQDEIAALKIWEDCNVPAVKNENTQTGAFMMDYVPPVEDRSVTSFQAFVLADIMHTPAGNFDYEFPPLLNNVINKLVAAHKRRGMEGGPDAADLELAVKVVETLLATQDHQELLHGDYRNQNIIYAENGPIIIDPKPCMGDSLYDIALWLADAADPDDIAVVQELVGGSADRLPPWVWALSVINERKPEASTSAKAEALKPQVIQWLDRNQG